MVNGAPFSREQIDRYVSEGHWHHEVLAARLLEIGKRDPDRELAVDPAGRLTYGRAAELMDRAARGLYALGVRQGDFVTVQLPNWCETLVIHFALEWLGAVNVPLPPIYRAKEVGYILGLTGAKVAFLTPSQRGFDFMAMMREVRGQAPALEHIIGVRATGGAGADAPEGVEVVTFDDLVGRWADQVPELTERPDPNVLNEIGFTSGSTGNPKGVMHTSNTLVAEHQQGLVGSGAPADAVIFMPSTVGHQLGLSVGVRTPVLMGTRVVFMDHWDPEVAVVMMAREKVTYTVGTPPFLMDVLRTKALERHGGLPDMKLWMLAGAVVSQALHDEAAARMPHLKIAHVFGMTEIGGMIVKPPGVSPERALATGIPQRGLEIKVLGPDRQEVAPHTDGELAMRSPSLFLGYFKEPEITAECMLADGFFLTGDQVRRDEEGWVWVTGRIKDLIKRGGENISPVEIESIVAQHPDVADVAAVGAPDPRLGERVCVFVVPRGDARPTLEEIIKLMQDSGVAKQKWPERVEILPSLPRTSIGKVHKAALRALLV